MRSICFYIIDHDANSSGACNCCDTAQLAISIALGDRLQNCMQPMNEDIEPIAKMQSMYDVGSCISQTMRAAAGAIVRWCVRRSDGENEHRYCAA